MNCGIILLFMNGVVGGIGSSQVPVIGFAWIAFAPDE